MKIQYIKEIIKKQKAKEHKNLKIKKVKKPD